jgi:hypothetical protein
LKQKPWILLSCFRKLPSSFLSLELELGVTGGVDGLSDGAGSLLHVPKVRRWFRVSSAAGNKPDPMLVLDTFVIDAAISFLLGGASASVLDACTVLGVGVC